MIKLENETGLALVDTVSERLRNIKRTISRFNKGERISDRKIQEIDAFLNDLVSGQFVDSVQPVSEYLSDLAELLAEMDKMRATIIAILKGEFDITEFKIRNVVELGLDTDKIYAFRRRVRIMYLRKELKRIERLFNRYGPDYYEFRVFLFKKFKEELDKWQISIDDLKRSENTFGQEFLTFFEKTIYL